MAIRRENNTLFFSFNNEIKANYSNHKKAVKDLIDRDAVFYKKTLFRSFLRINDNVLDDLLPTDQAYLDYSIMLTEHLMLTHAPFMKED